MMAEFIFCAGMRRAASTLQYQIVRALLAETGAGISIGWQIHQNWPQILAEYGGRLDYVALKTHAYRDQYRGHGKTVYIYRDLRDVAVSLMNKYDHPFERALVEIPAILADHYGWLTMPDLYSHRYEDLITAGDRGLVRMVEKLAAFLELDIGPTEVETIAMCHTLEAQKERLRQIDWTGAALGRRIRRDPETTLHQDHIISGAVGQWQGRLSPAEVADVEKLGLKYLMENGYLESTH
jgi:hypothetical protein